MPVGSSPTPPDRPASAARLASVVAAVQAGKDPGVRLTPARERALRSCPVVHDAIVLCLSPDMRLHLWEVDGVGYLSP